MVGWVALAFQSRQSLHAEVLFLPGNSPVRRAGREAAADRSVTRISRRYSQDSSTGATLVAVPRDDDRCTAPLETVWRLKSHLADRDSPTITGSIRRMANENPSWARNALPMSFC